MNLIRGTTESQRNLNKILLKTYPGYWEEDKDAYLLFVSYCMRNSCFCNNAKEKIKYFRIAKNICKH